MIKNINEDEMKQLKENYNYFIKFKKLVFIKNSIDKFLNRKLSLINALSVYNTLSLAKYKPTIYADYNIDYILLDYLNDNNIVDSDFIDIYTNLVNRFKDSDNTYNCEVYPILNDITKLLEIICSKLGVSISYCNTREMIVNEVEENFSFIKDSLIYYLEGYLESDEEVEENEEEDLVETFDTIFEDDSRVFCFPGVSIDNKYIKEINNLVKKETDGLNVGIFVENNLLYFSISLISLYNGFNIQVILVLICLLIEYESSNKNNKYIS